MRIMRGSVIAFTVLAAAVAAGSIGQSPAGAVEPERFTFPVDVVVPAPATSAQCGFTVLRRDQGSLTVALFYNQDGTVRAEIDGARQFAVTFFSPDTGKSFSLHNFQALYTFYTGNEPGDEVRAFLTGMSRHAHGTTTTAGISILDPVFAGFGPFGIPDIDQVGPSTAHGVVHTGAEFRQALCDILAP